MAFPSSPTNGQVYKNKIYNSTVLAWQDYNAIAPVSSEPSLGTLHICPTPSGNDILNGGSATTWTTVTASNAPTGAKGAWIFGHFQGSTIAAGAYQIYLSVRNMATTFSNDFGHGSYATISALVLQDSYFFMLLDSNKQFQYQIVVGGAGAPNTLSASMTLHGYWI